MFSRAALLLATLLFLAPLPASAATVVVVSHGSALGQQGAVFTAAPGEPNDVTVTHLGVGPDRMVLSIQDPGAVLQAGKGCSTLDAHAAQCSLRAGTTTWVDLGDGDDRLRTLLPYATIAIVANGGPGDDVLDIRTGGGNAFKSYEGILDGGGGRDRLYGSNWSDYLTDGDRDGAQAGAAPGPDVLDGGSAAPGTDDRGTTNDVLSYDRRTAAVQVDLAAHRPAGERGEGDLVRHFESVFGGAGTDRLAGTSGPNQLSGGPGRDTLIGRGGDDVFGARPPELFSGVPMPGDAASAARGDTISCGSGTDRVHGPANGQYIRPGCDLLAFRDAWGDAYPAVHRRSLSYTFECPLAEELDDACAGTLTLREARRGHRLLASGIFPRTGGELPVVARVRPTPTGRRLATRPRGVVATIRFRGHHVPRAWWKIRLRLPR